MAYEKTSVPVWQSQGDIRKMLAKYGGIGVAFVSQFPKEGLEAMIPIDGVTYKIRIQAQLPTKTRDQEQDLRRIWRVIFFHLKAVFEAAATGVLEFREMMLPYIVANDDKTIAQHILPKLSEAVAGQSERLLPRGKP
jgi:hypothetical protein